MAAATVAGLALAARASGIVLLPVLLWEFWRRRRNDRNQIFLYVPLSLLATSGLLIYMIFLWAAVGHPLAFATNRAAWMGGDSIGTGLLDVVMLKPFHFLKFPSLDPRLWDPWFFASFFLLSVVYWRRLSPSLVLFGLGVLLVPYLMLSGGHGFVGMSRFLLLAFPVFIIAAHLTKGRVWFGGERARALRRHAVRLYCNVLAVVLGRMISRTGESAKFGRTGGICEVVPVARTAPT